LDGRVALFYGPSSESGTVRSERLGGLETGMATFNRTPNTIGVRNAIYNL
jgi:hypothetical protein